MSCIEHLAQCVAQELVDDGSTTKMQQLVSNSKVAVDIALGIANAHRRSSADRFHKTLRPAAILA